MVKGTARLKTNLKLMSGGSTAVDYLNVGDSCWGDEGTTDIINIKIVQRVTGIITIFAQPCKATKTNLTIVQNSTPPGTEPPPVEPPVTIKHIVEVFIDGVLDYRKELD